MKTLQKIKTKSVQFFILIGCILCCLACNKVTQEQQTIKLPTLNDVPITAWNKLAKEMIYFGHQSVGTNIVAGMTKIIHENPRINLNISKVKYNAAYSFETPVFLHKGIGKNQYPISKIDDFKNNIENKFINKPNIAFFKFCFVDFTPNTDINKVFTHYKKVMASLKQNNPDIIFVHVTVPLTCYAPGPKGWIKMGKDLIKKIIGKVNVYDHSSANIFNDKLRKEFKGKEPLFDLALIESTYPDGTRASYQKNNHTYFKLVQKYTNDGGHLNDQGRKVVAEQLLIFLANLTNQDQNTKIHKRMK